MSLSRDVAQKLVDIFADQLAEVELGTITKSIDPYTPLDQQTEAGLIQAFAPTIETAEGSFGQRLSTLTFQIEYSRTDSTARTTGNVVERYGQALRLDPTLGGLVLRSGLTSRVADVAAGATSTVDPDERGRTVMTVFAVIDDGDINQLESGASINRNKIDLLPVSGRASDLSLLTNVLAEDSTVIPGAIEITTSVATNFPSWAWDDVGFPAEFPLDVTASTLRVWRALVYMQPGTLDGVASFALRFGSIAGSNVDSVQYSFIPAIGWNEFVVDLDTTPTATNGTFDETAMVNLQFSLIVIGIVMDGFQVKRIFQYPRDQGNTSGLSLGF